MTIPYNESKIFPFISFEFSLILRGKHDKLNIVAKKPSVKMKKVYRVSCFKHLKDKIRYDYLTLYPVVCYINRVANLSRHYVEKTFI